MVTDYPKRAIIKDDRNTPSPQDRSLHDESAAEIRNEQRSGNPAFADKRPDGPEPNVTLRRIWSEPGGEAYNYRNAMLGAGGEALGHDDLTTAETPPDNIRHISDPTLSASDDGTDHQADGDSQAAGREDAAKDRPDRKPPGGLASSLQPGGTIPGGGPGASVGSIGTGGGQSAGAPSGSRKRDGK